MIYDMKESVSWADANPVLYVLVVMVTTSVGSWVLLTLMGWVWHLTN